MDWRRTTQHQKVIDDVWWNTFRCVSLNLWCVYLHLNINFNLISENLLPDSSVPKSNQGPDQIVAEILIDFLQTNRLGIAMHRERRSLYNPNLKPLP